MMFRIVMGNGDIKIEILVVIFIINFFIVFWIVYIFFR